MAEAESEFRVLDEETLKDPPALLDLLGHLLEGQQRQELVLAMTALLLLFRLEEFEPDEQAVEDAVAVLKAYLPQAERSIHHGMLADQLRDFLGAPE